MSPSKLSPELEQLVEQWKQQHGLEGLLLLSAAVEQLQKETLEEIDTSQPSPCPEPLPYAVMGSHPDGGLFVSFDSDSDAEAALEQMQKLNPSGGYVLSPATAEHRAIIRFDSSSNKAINHE